jgi:phospholipase/carboxylesterase
MPPDHARHTRREVLRTLALAATGAALPACPLESPGDPQIPLEPRLTARPGTPSSTSPKGRQSFGVPASSAVIHVPAGVDRARPTGLFVFLHGALRTVDFFMDGFQPLADRANVIVLAPYASSGTWDAVRRGAFGNDVGVINDALRWTFQRWTIDPAKLVLSGFSDGGTYSLAIGRANGNLFSRVVAFSPGFLIAVSAVGQPPILISHGTEDTVLPIQQTSRLIVPALRGQGYTVDYREFTGPHAVPLSVADEIIQSLA